MLLMLPILIISPLPPSRPVHDCGSQDESGSLEITDGGDENVMDSINIGVNACTISITPKKLTSNTCFPASREVSSAAPWYAIGR